MDRQWAYINLLKVWLDGASKILELELNFGRYKVRNEYLRSESPRNSHLTITKCLHHNNSDCIKNLEDLFCHPEMVFGVFYGRFLSQWHITACEEERKEEFRTTLRGRYDSDDELFLPCFCCDVIAAAALLPVDREKLEDSARRRVCPIAWHNFC